MTFPVSHLEDFPCGRRFYLLVFANCPATVLNTRLNMKKNAKIFFFLANTNVVIRSEDKHRGKTCLLLSELHICSLGASQ